MAKSKQERIEEGKRKYVESMLAFNGTEFEFDEGYLIRFELEVVEVSQDFPLGFYYEFNLFGPDKGGKPTVRILAAGNSHAPTDAKHPYDHWHETKKDGGNMPIGVKKGRSVKVDDIGAHMGYFVDRSKKLLAELGVSEEILGCSAES
jgi:hypothetical protein